MPKSARRSSKPWLRPFISRVSWPGRRRITPWPPNTSCGSKRWRLTASIRPEAEYDAAASLVALAAWDRAALILNNFRADHPEHALQGEVTKQLANVYREAGRDVAAAEEYLRIADHAEDATQRGESLLLAGEYFARGAAAEQALAAYGSYVDEFSEPLELNVETRQTMADLVKSRDRAAYLAQLETIVGLDAQAGTARTDRTRYLAAHAALVLATPSFEYFAGMDLVLPFEASLQDKQSRMDSAMAAMEALVAYEVAGVTAAATFYMAEIYRNFSASLMASERPPGLMTPSAKLTTWCWRKRPIPLKSGPWTCIWRTSS